MNSLALLYLDEFRGFTKSRVMLALWVGLPLLALILHAWSPAMEDDLPLSAFTALIVSSISGTLASAMLAVSIIHERSRHVYELFLIRPMQRRDILLAKFLAVYSGLAIAAVLAVLVGLAFDYVDRGAIPSALLNDTLKSLGLSLSMTAIASAVGMLIGVISTSVLLGVILVIYGGNQIVGIAMLPALLNFSGNSVLTFAAAAVIAGVVVYGAVLVFDRQQF
jgi:ABC-2 type transport system permease protein